MLAFKSFVAVASAALVFFAEASNAVAVPDLAVAKRSGGLIGNKEAAVARRNAVKDALARRREKRAGRMSFAQQMAAQKAAAAAAAQPAAAPASSASGSGAVDQSRVLSGPVALAAQGRRCGSSVTCALSTTPPANAAAICLLGRCSFQCNEGYAPSSDGNGCIAVVPICNNGKVCTQPANGYSSCDASGQCVPGCDAGYTGVTSTSGSFACLNLRKDATNCGAPGTVCPASYNGIGSAYCAFGSCSISCPIGSFLRRAMSESNPYYCYNGEGSLVSNGPQ